MTAGLISMVRSLLWLWLATMWLKVLATPNAFNGYVVTCNDLEPVEETRSDSKAFDAGIGGQLVQFHAHVKGPFRETKAAILENVYDSGKTVGRPWNRQTVFYGTTVNPSRFQGRINSGSNKTLERNVPFFNRPVLLCMHGFRTQPEDWLKSCTEAQEKTTKMAIVPVIWPAANEGLFGYVTDRRENAPGAAEAFRPLLDVTKSLKKSIMCHSMGNYVLRIMAPPHKKNETHFQNVFMVAPDVHYNIFNEEQNDDEEDTTRNHGRNICSMTKNKVHVLHSWNDAALFGRRFLNGFKKALGTNGPQGKMAKDIEAKVKNENFYNKVHVLHSKNDAALKARRLLNVFRKGTHGPRGKMAKDIEAKVKKENFFDRNTARLFYHNYQFLAPTIKYYEEEAVINITTKKK